MEGVRHESDFRSYEGSPVTAAHFPGLVVRCSLRAKIRHGAQLTNGKEKNGAPASRTALNFANSRVPTNVILGDRRVLDSIRSSFRTIRAVGSSGETIEFMLSPKRDLIAAKLFLRLALSAGGPPPRVINVLSLPNGALSKQHHRRRPSVHQEADQTRIPIGRGSVSNDRRL